MKNTSQKSNTEETQLEKTEALAINALSELLAVDNLIKSNISHTLPNDMELSHFMVLNYFFHLKGEKTPAQLAKIFRVYQGGNDQHNKQARAKRLYSFSSRLE
jgi:hypothetical protein